MNLIVAVDNNWAIGCKGGLLVRIPNDHKAFRQETAGKVVVLEGKHWKRFRRACLWWTERISFFPPIRITG